MITLEQYISGRQKTIDNIPEVMSEWNSIDDFLIEEYITSFHYLKV